MYSSGCECALTAAAVAVGALAGDFFGCRGGRCGDFGLVAPAAWLAADDPVGVAWLEKARVGWRCSRAEEAAVPDDDDATAPRHCEIRPGGRETSEPADTVQAAVLWAGPTAEPAERLARDHIVPSSRERNCGRLGEGFF